MGWVGHIFHPRTWDKGRVRKVSGNLWDSSGYIRCSMEAESCRTLSQNQERKAAAIKATPTEGVAKG